jgi:hypothetical protein
VFTMNDLVRRLSEGNHPVEISLRPEKTVNALRAALDRDYVHVRFINTRGGTELGFRPDKKLSDLSRADFENQSGRITLTGNLTLDYEEVRCIAEIDLVTLEGLGHLRLIDD